MTPRTRRRHARALRHALAGGSGGEAQYRGTLDTPDRIAWRVGYHAGALFAAREACGYVRARTGHGFFTFRGEHPHGLRILGERLRETSLDWRAEFRATRWA